MWGAADTGPAPGLMTWGAFIFLGGAESGGGGGGGGEGRCGGGVQVNAQNALFG